MGMYAGDELNCREWTRLEPVCERPYWAKRVWMNGKPIWLKAYPRLEWKDTVTMDDEASARWARALATCG
jgi:hypothetical protein